MRSTLSLNRGKIVNDESLILYLDAANPESYPGSGTSWYDLTKYNNHGTLINGPTFVSDQIGGSFSFNSTVVSNLCPNPQAVTCANSDTLGSLGVVNDFTLAAWIKISTYQTGVDGPGNGASENNSVIISKGNNNFAAAPYEWRLRYGNGFSDSTMTLANGTLNWAVGAGYAPPTGSWVYVAYTVRPVLNTSVSFTSYFNNNTPVTTTSGYPSFGITNDPTKPLYIGGREGNRGYPFSGSIAIAQIYNRSLSDQEIFQNFNALKSRFGYF